VERGDPIAAFVVQTLPKLRQRAEKGNNPVILSRAFYPKIGVSSQHQSLSATPEISPSTC
jgi:hypothetical protein